MDENGITTCPGCGMPVWRFRLAGTGCPNCEALERWNSGATAVLTGAGVGTP